MLKLIIATAIVAIATAGVHSGNTDGVSSAVTDTLQTGEKVVGHAADAALGAIGNAAGSLLGGSQQGGSQHGGSQNSGLNNGVYPNGGFPNGGFPNGVFPNGVFPNGPYQNPAYWPGNDQYNVAFFYSLGIYPIPGKGLCSCPAVFLNAGPPVVNNPLGSLVSGTAEVISDVTGTLSDVGKGVLGHLGGLSKYNK